ALYKNETGGNEFLFVLAILLSASAYGFWYLTEVAHARTALWAVEKQAGMDIIRQQRLFRLGLVGQWTTFVVLVGSFACSIVGLTFDFVLGDRIGLDRSDAAWIVGAGLIAIAAGLFWFFTSVMGAIRHLDAA
ncbi:MAG: hypothetical protein ING19_02685, partial [Azospirillum sp.]|nr:hypothetical protein [Azospirillum sp.]